MSHGKPACGIRPQAGAGAKVTFAGSPPPRMRAIDTVWRTRSWIRRSGMQIYAEKTIRMR